MADPKGFLKFERIDNRYRPVAERIHDYNEVEASLPQDMRRYQARRCMDCGIPFCHWACPVGSLIPEWQEKIQAGDWKAAYQILQKTNNFPEFTGRLCPAPCESGCVLGINDEAVTIRANELSVIENAFAEGWVLPNPPKHRTGRRVAVIGSGPAGLAAADSLNQAGHSVTLFEASDKVGGYLRYGVPDFKLEKRFIDRRVELMLAEGLEIRTGVKVGVDFPVEKLKAEYDAVCLTIGSRQPRDLNIPGRELDGIYFALDYLEQSNRSVAGQLIPPDDWITAEDRHVVVLGGGDTGSDCVGTANRQGAKSVTQVELVPEFPRDRPPTHPWPLFPRLYQISSSHREGCERLFSVLTKEFISDRKKSHVKKIRMTRLDWGKHNNGHADFTEVPNSEFYLKADLVLLALGFVHVEKTGLVELLGLDLTPRGTIAVDANYMSSIGGIFSAGDSNRGASLVVWAISEGRAAARSIDRYLQGD
ncbi:MAG TPA: glutamate synthase subunit beta [Aggregatilineaceae bacterium]|nr:glutamate synthase subunit beta [Aggregatilineaceae bacterium]